MFYVVRTKGLRRRMRRRILCIYDVILSKVRKAYGIVIHLTKILG
jgi:hypothetical protein